MTLQHPGVPDLHPLLLVEHEGALRRSLQRELEREGHTVRAVASAEDALAVAGGEPGDLGLVLLDTTLPDLSGFEVLRRLRRMSDVPVVLISSRRAAIDKIYGLDLGADDYVGKPFDMGELLARVRAQIRRAWGVADHQRSAPIDFGACRLDRERREVLREGTPVRLQPRAYDLLEYLATRPGRVLTRREILDAVWGGTYSGSGRTLDVHLRWLRQAIEPDASNPRHLITVPRVGYRFELSPRPRNANTARGERAGSEPPPDAG